MHTLAVLKHLEQFHVEQRLTTDTAPTRRYKDHLHRYLVTRPGHWATGQLLSCARTANSTANEPGFTARSFSIRTLASTVITRSSVRPENPRGPTGQLLERVQRHL